MPTGTVLRVEQTFAPSESRALLKPRQVHLTIGCNSEMRTTPSRKQSRERQERSGAVGHQSTQLTLPTKAQQVAHRHQKLLSLKPALSGSRYTMPTCWHQDASLHGSSDSIIGSQGTAPLATFSVWARACFGCDSVIHPSLDCLPRWKPAASKRLSDSVASDLLHPNACQAAKGQRSK